MLSYCLKCRKNAESKNPKSLRTKNGRIMLIPKCQVWDSKSASELLSSVVIKVPLSKMLLLGPLLFYGSKMNEIVSFYYMTFLLLGDKYMPEIHLRQPGFIYSACGSFTRNKE